MERRSLGVAVANTKRGKFLPVVGLHDEVPRFAEVIRGNFKDAANICFQFLHDCLRKPAGPFPFDAIRDDGNRSRRKLSELRRERIVGVASQSRKGPD